MTNDNKIITERYLKHLTENALTVPSTYPKWVNVLKIVNGDSEFGRWRELAHNFDKWYKDSKEAQQLDDDARVATFKSALIGEQVALENLIKKI